MRIPRHLLTLALVGALGVTVGACATPPSSGEPSPTFDTEPATAQPRFAFVWRDQLTSWDYLSVEPKEFAQPSHVGPSDEVVVATSEGEVVKMQAGNGEVLWRNRVGGTFHAGPVIGTSDIFVADLGGAVRALELASGEEKWVANLDHSVETRGAVDDGRLFVADTADQLHAFDAETGEILWTYERDLPEYFTIKGNCTPVVDSDAVYCGFSDGFLAAIQIDTGELIWEVDLSGGSANFADVDGEVKVIGGRIYAASYSGGVYALKRDSGTPIWRADVGSVADFLLSDGKVYVASAIGRVAAFDAEDGAPLWGFKMSRAIPGSIATFGPYLLAFTTEGPVYVLDGATGYAHLKWHGSSGFLASVESGSSRLYGITNHGQVFGMKLGY